MHLPSLLSFGIEWIAIFYSLFSDTRLEATVRMAPVRRGTIKFVVIIVAVVLLLSIFFFSSILCFPFSSSALPHCLRATCNA